jgi:hypothetical protein
MHSLLITLALLCMAIAPTVVAGHPKAGAPKDSE